VFNAVAQFRVSIGMSVMAVVAAAVTKRENNGEQGQGNENRLLAGYRASFGIAFSWMGLACIVGAFGLRRMGTVGLKGV